MRMIHLCLCPVTDAVSRLHRMAGINHVLIEDGMIHKTAESAVNRGVVHGADIRAEIGFDAKRFQICRRLHTGLIRIIQLPGDALVRAGVLVGQLPRVTRRDIRRHGKPLCQLLDQILSGRQGILRHENEIIGIGTQIRAKCPRPAVIKLIRRDFPGADLHPADLRADRRLPEQPLQRGGSIRITGIQQQSPAHRERLLRQPAERFRQSACRMISWNDHINYHLSLVSAVLP